MKYVFSIFVAVFLLGCSGPELPLSKSQPSDVSAGSLLQPPWEALVKAGPGADKEIDLETLNGPQKQPELQPAEVPDSKEIVAAPEPKKIVRKPGDTEIKAVAVLAVSGSGGAELTSAMREVLQGAGWPVLNLARGDALSIQGHVALDAAKDGQQLVHLVWVVSTPKGKVLGEIKQNNPVPAGSLDSGWGENAGFATEAAAGGIFKLIEKFR